jgi:hypothetical protein
MPVVEFNSAWFRLYLQAVLESDPEVLPIYLKNALNEISETLARPDLDENERHAITIAARNLYLVGAKL